MVCRQCHTANPADNKFCKECGAAIGQAPASPGGLEPEAAAQVAEFLDRAFAASEQDALEDAILACKAALVLHPRSATAHSLLASLYERRNDIPSAIAELEAVLVANPESEADREKLAQLQGRLFMQNSAPALAAYPLARKLSPPVLAAVVTALVVMLVGSMAMLKGAAPRAETPVNAPAADYPNYAYAPNYQAAPQSYPNADGSGASQTQGQPQPPPQAQGGAVYPIGEPREPAPVQTPAPRAQPQVDRSLPPIPSMPLTVARPQEQLPPLPGTGSVRASAPVSRPKPSYAAPQIDITTHEASDQPRARRQPAPISESPTPAAGGNSEAAARRYQAAGNYEGALTAYRNALSTASDTGPIHQQMGLCLQRLQRYSQAKEAYQQAISAYQTAIASGRNVENARQGIESCEAAIAVCEGQ
ncbi:MAG: hypothetical protein IT210_21055 [Armatimonadetes bacterium]|nr:hypothetical protein [Armatimonadota bacterium]